MALSDKELRRRVRAARELRGIAQDALGLLFEADGLGKHDPGRIERGDIPMMPAHRRAFEHHLRVPEAWFTEPDVDVIVGLKPARSLTPEASRDLLQRLLDGHDQVADQGQRGTPRRRDDEGREGPAAGGGDA